MVNMLTMGPEEKKKNHGAVHQLTMKSTKAAEMVEQTVVFPSPMFTKGKHTHTHGSSQRKRKRSTSLSELSIEERVQAAGKAKPSKLTASSNRKLPKTESPVNSNSNLPNNEPAVSSNGKVSKVDQLVAQLTQGLQSGDKTLLTNAFQERNEATIVNTVKRLHLHVIHPLMKEVVTRLHGHPQSVIVMVPWMKHILRLHMAHIKKQPDMMSTLIELNKYCEGRQHAVTRRLEAQGKLGLLLSRVSTQNEAEETANSAEPLMACQNDSDSDNDPLPMEIGGGFESEDNWEDSDAD